MKSSVRTIAIRRAAPLFIAVTPIIAAIILFLLAMVLIQLSGGLSAQPKTGFSLIIANIGDICAALAYLIWSVIVPLGLFVGAALYVVRRLTQRKK